MEGIVKKFFDQKLGHFVHVLPENMEINPTGGRMSLRKAEFKAEVFDQLHFPIAIKGGYIDEMMVEVPMGFFSSGVARVVIKDVFLVVGPHASTWSRENVYQCKTKLIDLIMKVYDLKPAKKIPTKKAPNKKGYFGDLKDRFVEDIKQKLLGMLEVNISGVHIRYEDSITQAIPFAAGFKLGYINVSSSLDLSDLRASGDWKQSTAKHAVPFFGQKLTTRRVSAYWDLGKDRIDFTPGPVNGDEIKKVFRRLNIRETFSVCVVDKILDLYKPEHPRRKNLEGPAFRERLDFHQYILFPASLSAHVLVNKNNIDATRLQKAPMKDADVIVNPLEVALDSEQLRSVNELMAHNKDFNRKDRLFRSRPQERISQHLARNATSSSSSSSQEARKDCVRQWWQHALLGVRILCDVPKSSLDASELREKAKLREKYVELTMEVLGAVAEADPKGTGIPLDTIMGSSANFKRLREMQMHLPLMEVLDWNLRARDRRRDLLGRQQDEDNDETKVEADPQAQTVMPNTIQLHVRFRAFQAYFLVAADNYWKLALKQKDGQAPKQPNKSTRATLTRQTVVKAQILDVQTEMVQKGARGKRMCRWFELGIGSVSVVNCNTKEREGSLVQILSIVPFEYRTGHPLCFFLGATMYQETDKDESCGGAPLAAMLDPAWGTAAHLQELTPEKAEKQLGKLGPLRHFKDEPGRTMTFAFVQCGHVRALDYTPFRRRLMHIVKRGRYEVSTDLARRPSPAALDRELLVKLQRKVEKLTGKSTMLGILECTFEGVRARMVDHYNSLHVLCKEVSLASMRVKAFRNGCPQTFQVQFHQLGKQSLASAGGVAAPLSVGSGFGLLPWKVAMMLLPKADFQLGMDVGESAEKPDRPIASHEKQVQQAKKQANLISSRSMDPQDIMLVGASFLKWGRNGKAKSRFVFFDSEMGAIVWKDNARDKVPIGAIPLAKIQDITLGVQTPVLIKVSSANLKPDKVWSIVAAERTLDLQAESAAQRNEWVTALKARYKQHVQDQNRQHDGDEPAATIPRAVEKRVRAKAAYPEEFRSPHCQLASTYRKLQAITALGNSLRSPGATGVAS